MHGVSGGHLVQGRSVQPSIGGGLTQPPRRRRRSCLKELAAVRVGRAKPRDGGPPARAVDRAGARAGRHGSFLLSSRQ